VRIAVLQETARPHRFCIIEAWRDEASFQERESAAFAVAWRGKLGQLRNGPPDQRLHQPFAEDSRPWPAGSARLFIVTHVDVPPPRREETEKIVRVEAEASRNDAGNLRYEVFQQNAPRTNHFTAVAAWDSLDAFIAHESGARTRQFRESLGPMLGALYDERLYLALS
jgi:quinol monooxygenase YgiN